MGLALLVGLIGAILVGASSVWGSEQALKYGYDGATISSSAVADAQDPASDQGLRVGSASSQSSHREYDGRSQLANASAPPDTFDSAPRAAGSLDEAFHYTFDDAVESISRNGLRPGSYATPAGNLSPLQAQIDLAENGQRIIPVGGHEPPG